MLRSKLSMILSVAALLVAGVVLGSASETRSQKKFKAIYSFTGGVDGYQVLGNLAVDQTGNLYGTTASGGAHSGGTVFEITRNSHGRWTKKVLYSFCSRTDCTDGENPYAGVISSADGTLYGTTRSGGKIGAGTVYELRRSQNQWTERVLHSFGNDEGSSPIAALSSDSSGNLYGTTFEGGVYQHGTVFRLSPHANENWTEDILYNFTGGEDGGVLAAGVTLDAAGNLYGMTVQGGRDGLGIVFRLRPTRGVWALSVLHSFTGGKDGGAPANSGITMDAAGNAYGTTALGGLYEHGVVFKLMPSTGKWKETELHSFSKPRNGEGPFSGVVFDSAGNLYGTTLQGGQVECGGVGCGVVFKLVSNSRGGWKETPLWRFAGSPGGSPNGGLVLSPSGNLYGTTTGDGVTTFGSVFEITP